MSVRQHVGGSLTLQNTNVGIWATKAIKKQINKVTQNTVNTEIINRCEDLNRSGRAHV